MPASVSIAIPQAGAGAHSSPAARAELVICPYCDTVHRRLPVAGRARCTTCGAPLYRGRDDLAAMLALVVMGVASFAIATAYPLVELIAKGKTTSATLWQAITADSGRNLPLAAMVLAISLVIAPLLELTALIYMIVPLLFGLRPPLARTALRALDILRPWRMVEVFVLGVAIAIVKLGAIAIAHVEWGVAGIAGLAVAFAALGTFDRDTLWRRTEELARDPRSIELDEGLPS